MPIWKKNVSFIKKKTNIEIIFKCLINFMWNQSETYKRSFWNWRTLLSDIWYLPIYSLHIENNEYWNIPGIGNCWDSLIHYLLPILIMLSTHIFPTVRITEIFLSSPNLCLRLLKYQQI